jgi:hypothetical protein
VNIWREGTPGSGYSKAKGPEAIDLDLLRECKGAGFRIEWLSGKVKRLNSRSHSP